MSWVSGRWMAVDVVMGSSLAGLMRVMTACGSAFGVGLAFGWIATDDPTAQAGIRVWAAAGG